MWISINPHGLVSLSTRTPLSRRTAMENFILDDALNLAALAIMLGSFAVLAVTNVVHVIKNRVA
jgi:hypothetical protein